MEPKIARKLEKELEEAIAEVIVNRLGLRWLPLLPARHTMQMMAKAAYKTAVEEHERKQGE